MKHLVIRTRYVLVLQYLLALFFLFSCTLRVEKIKPPPLMAFESQQQDSILRVCCNGDISTNEKEFAAGKYEIQLTTKGSSAYEVYPLIKLKLNDSIIKEIRLDSNYTLYRIPFSLTKEGKVKIKLRFDQDGLDDKGNDRDVYIKNVDIKKIRD